VEILSGSGELKPACLEVVARGRNNDNLSVRADSSGRAVFPEVPVDFFPLTVQVPALDIEKQVEVPKVAVKLMVLQAREYKKIGDYRLAVEKLNRVIELRPNGYLEIFLYDRGVAYFLMKDMAAAKADFSSAIDRNKCFARAYYSRAGCHLEQKDYQSAIDDMTSAIDITTAFHNNQIDVLRQRCPGWVTANTLDDFEQNLILDEDLMKQALWARAGAYAEIDDKDKSCGDLQAGCNRGDQEACRSYSDNDCR
jgi:tetratricopeptide (TPR) repeat protein